MTARDDIYASLEAGDNIRDDSRFYWLMDGEVYSCCFNGCCEADWPTLDAWWQASAGRNFQISPPDVSDVAPN